MNTLSYIYDENHISIFNNTNELSLDNLIDSMKLIQNNHIFYFNGFNENCYKMLELFSLLKNINNINKIINITLKDDDDIIHINNVINKNDGKIYFSNDCVKIDYHLYSINIKNRINELDLEYKNIQFMLNKNINCNKYFNKIILYCHLDCCIDNVYCNELYLGSDDMTGNKSSIDNIKIKHVEKLIITNVISKMTEFISFNNIKNIEIDSHCLSCIDFKYIELNELVINDCYHNNIKYLNFIFTCSTLNRLICNKTRGYNFYGIPIDFPYSLNIPQNLNYANLNNIYINIMSFKILIEQLIDTNKIIKVNIKFGDFNDGTIMFDLILKYGYDNICSFLCYNEYIGIYNASDFGYQFMCDDFNK